MRPDSVILQGVDLNFPSGRGFFSSLKNLISKNNNDYKALQGINLNVKSGEVFGLIGKNGSGKSTILRIIAGIYTADAGRCEVRGSTSLLAGIGTGFSQHQTGIENALLYGSILGHSEDAMQKLLPEIIAFSELGDFINKPLRTYSAGMKARLGLAVASAICPDILLIDEVLGVGDPQFKEKSKSRILELVKKTGTVIIVSHSFGLLTDICDRVGVVHEGELKMIGEPKDAINAYYELTG